MAQSNPEAAPKCALCGDATNIVFNIRFRATPVCESCASAITRQQVTALTEPASNDAPSLRDEIAALLSQLTGLYQRAEASGDKPLAWRLAQAAGAIESAVNPKAYETGKFKDGLREDNSDRLNSEIRTQRGRMVE